MPLTTAEAQALHEAGAAFASRSADLRVAEDSRITTQVLGKPVTDDLLRDIDKAHTAWRKAHTRFHGLIDDLKEETP